LLGLAEKPYNKALQGDAGKTGFYTFLLKKLIFVCKNSTPKFLRPLSAGSLYSLETE
jgi:hypothetical protein